MGFFCFKIFWVFLINFFLFLFEVVIVLIKWVFWEFGYLVKAVI